VEFLNVWDLILSPFYLIILTFIAKRHRDKNYPVGHPLRQYYMPGLYVKFFGSIFIGLIYAYYYKGGDTFNYFYHTKLINASLDKSVFTWFKLITHTPVDKAPEIYNYVSEMYWYNAPPEYAVAVIAAFIGLLTKYGLPPYRPHFRLPGLFRYLGHVPHLRQPLPEADKAPGAGLPVYSQRSGLELRGVQGHYLYVRTWMDDPRCFQAFRKP
jgi:hypothetical protein